MKYSPKYIVGLQNDIVDDVVITLDLIAEVGLELSALISLGDLSNEITSDVGVNADGDTQKPLDVLADESYLRKLNGSPVKFYASEEQDDILTINSKGTVGLAIDPLDGSSNIDTNVSIGSIFSIKPLPSSVNETNFDTANVFCSAGSDQLAAGYIIFGPQTVLVLTVGCGVCAYTLDRDKKQFILSKSLISIPPDTKEFAINTSNARHWSKRMRTYVDDSVAGKSGPRGIDFNMRWVASLVAETHRILSRGGIFIYPADSRKGYEKGRLRMLYECAPIAFLIEQASGAATDSYDRILDKGISKVHDRTPFAFGSKNEISRLQAYHDLPESEISPLFKKRGLFNS